MASQLPLFPTVTAKFPSTRYQGSKSKLVDWIWAQISNLDFQTSLDAFAGTGAVAYRLKQQGKQVTYNDLLRFNFYIGQALIENSQVNLSAQDVDWLTSRHSHLTYPHFIQDTFADVYFTDEENHWLDQTITNVREIADPCKFALAFYALCQACIVKRPYNLFHRKNLYIRLAEVDRSFGNKTSWDKPFEAWFKLFVDEANQAVFDNGYENRVFNLDAVNVPGEYDLVYLDPPYISRRGAAVDYLDFYHFLEGLAMYDAWQEYIDYKSKHRRLKLKPNPWTNKKQIHVAFDAVFERFQNSILVVSYRNDGIPSIPELTQMLRRYKRQVRVEYFGQYKYVLSTNGRSEEVLLIGT